jgi:hypothetical protein
MVSSTVSGNARSNFMFDFRSTAIAREPPQSACFSFIVMSKRFEDQSWYPEWKKTIDRVVAARMALDATQLGTTERETADREYEAALAAFRLVAEKHR